MKKWLLVISLVALSCDAYAMDREVESLTLHSHVVKYKPARHYDRQLEAIKSEFCPHRKQGCSDCVYVDAVHLIFQAIYKTSTGATSASYQYTFSRAKVVELTKGTPYTISKKRIIKKLMKNISEQNGGEMTIVSTTLTIAGHLQSVDDREGDNDHIQEGSDYGIYDRQAISASFSQLPQHISIELYEIGKKKLQNEDIKSPSYFKFVISEGKAKVTPIITLDYI